MQGLLAMPRPIKACCCGMQILLVQSKLVHGIMTANGVQLKESEADGSHAKMQDHICFFAFSCALRVIDADYMSSLQIVLGLLA